jgi:LEA14-like dessication related protein
MMKPFWGVLSLVFGILLIRCTSFTSLPSQPEAPEVQLVNITPMDTTMFEQRLQVDLRVRNPNVFDLQVIGLDFTLQLNEQRLARGLMNKASTIPRLGDSVLSVETTTSTFDVMRQLLNLSQRQDVTYQVKGVLHLDGTRLPFDSEGVIFDASQLPSSTTKP